MFYLLLQRSKKDYLRVSRNPCYDGRGCFIRQGLCVPISDHSRNPCYDGRGCFMRKYEFDSKILGRNPCYDGRGCFIKQCEGKSKAGLS